MSYCLIAFKQWLSTKGKCPQGDIWQCDIFNCYKWVGPGMLLNILQYVGQPLITNNPLAPKVDNAEVEKTCLKYEYLPKICCIEGMS